MKIFREIVFVFLLVIACAFMKNSIEFTSHSFEKVNEKVVEVLSQSEAACEVFNISKEHLPQAVEVSAKFDYSVFDIIGARLS